MGPCGQKGGVRLAKGSAQEGAFSGHREAGDKSAQPHCRRELRGPELDLI